MANETKSSAELAREKRKARIEKAGADRVEKAEKKANQSVTKKRLKWIIPLAVAVIALVVALLFYFGVPQRSTSAVKLADGTKVSVAEYEYYYKYFFTSTINTAYQYDQYYEGYGYYATGYDYTRTPENQEFPLDMISDEADATALKEFAGKDAPTWADYLKYQSIQASQIYNYCYNKANEAGLKLDEDAQKEIDEAIESYREEAAENNYALNAYLKETYGRGMNEKLLRQIFEKSYMYSLYFEDVDTKYVDGLADETIMAYFNENADDFKTVDFRYFELVYEPITNTEDDASTTDVNEATNYTEDELAALNANAKAKKEAAANEFLSKATAQNFTSLTQLYCDEEYISSYATEDYSAATDIKKSDILSYYSEDYANWVYDSSRAVGDKNLFTIENEDGSVTYSIVLMTSLPSLDETVPVSVRHILVKELTEDDGVTDDDGNAVTRTLEEAKAEAQSILDTYNAGEKTEDAFSALASEKSDDSGSTDNGGLYEDITADSSYVTPFKSWALSSDRKAGDVEIVEVTSEQSGGSYAGYHIMYYVGPAKYPVWKQNVVDTLESNYINGLYDEIFNSEVNSYSNRIERIKNRVEDYAAKLIAQFTAEDETTTVATDTTAAATESTTTAQ